MLQLRNLLKRDVEMTVNAQDVAAFTFIANRKADMNVDTENDFEDNAEDDPETISEDSFIPSQPIKSRIRICVRNCCETIFPSAYG